jgi:hypothetical protein
VTDAPTAATSPSPETLANRYARRVAKAWLKQRKALWHLGTSRSRPYLSFDRHQLGHGPSNDMWLYAFRAELGDLTRELINLINEWSYTLARLEAWQLVLSEADEDLKGELLYEFVQPLAESALNMPYRVKQALIYTAYRALDFRFRTNPPLEDDKITFRALRQAAVGHPAAAKMVAALGGVDTPEYRKLTSDFRRRYHHRLAPGVEIGLLSAVKRFVRDEGIGFDFGVIEALPLGTVISACGAERSHAIDAFTTLWELACDLERSLSTSPGDSAEDT